MSRFDSAFKSIAFPAPIRLIKVAFKQPGFETRTSQMSNGGAGSSIESSRSLWVETKPEACKTAEVFHAEANSVAQFGARYETLTFWGLNLGGFGGGVYR